MPRKAHIHYVSLRSSLVNLPISIYGPLLERNIRPQHLAIHLKLVSSAQKQSGNVEAYVGWTGMASASSLNHFSSTQNSEKALETVEIDPQYAQGLGLSQGDLVEIGLLHDLPLAKSVGTEPLTSDDWDIIEIHASHVESTLLSQVRVVKVGQEIDVWVMGRTRVRLRVVTIDPSSKGSALLLTTNTEVSIAPKLHRSVRQKDTNTREEKDASRDIPTSAGNEAEQKHISHTLRLLPFGLAHVTLPDYPGPEFVGYVSPLTYQRLCPEMEHEEGAYICCAKFTFKRLPPPSEPPSSSSPVPPPPPPPVPRVIVPAASGTDSSSVENDQVEDVIFVGSVPGIPDSHIVFPAAPRGLEDWDLVVYAGHQLVFTANLTFLDRLHTSDNTSHQSVKVNANPTSTVTSAIRGLLVLATAASTASLHPLVNAAHIFQEEIKVKPPNNDARRDIIKSIVDGRLAVAQDIRLDTEAPLNYTALATQTEGYSVIDLQDLVGRAIHQVAIRAADGKQSVYL
ncbi:hypothetical protein C0992_004955 [Termitomyces sp. T32_za158]|nr:hypothetical protein C0992_004955 [Termitomyces sp. T32_za158]